jgi:hypothetical protein
MMPMTFPATFDYSTTMLLVDRGLPPSSLAALVAPNVAVAGVVQRHRRGPWERDRPVPMFPNRSRSPSQPRTATSGPAGSATSVPCRHCQLWLMS